MSRGMYLQSTALFAYPFRIRLRTRREANLVLFNIEYTTHKIVAWYYNVVLKSGMNSIDGNILSPYRSIHFLFFTGSGGSNAAKIASSNTFFNPFWYSKEITISFITILLFKNNIIKKYNYFILLTINIVTNKFITDLIKIIV